MAASECGEVLTQCLPLPVMPTFCHLISWQQSRLQLKNANKREQSRFPPRQSAYGNMDVADGVGGYLCMSNFALL